MNTEQLPSIALHIVKTEKENAVVHCPQFANFPTNETNDNIW